MPFPSHTAGICGDTSEFKDRPWSSSWEFPGCSVQMQHWANSRALPFRALPDRQENTSWEVAENHLFKVTVNTCRRRNLKGWDNFLTVHFRQMLILVGYLLWRIYSQTKMNPDLGDWLPHFQKKWERRGRDVTGILYTPLRPSHDDKAS